MRGLKKGLQTTFFRSGTSRRTAAVSADASAKTSETHGAAASSLTSAGALHNSAEVSRDLDGIIVTLDKDEILTIQQEDVADRLWRLTESYQNSRLPDETPPWSCSKEEAEWISLAAHCSKLVYGASDGRGGEPVEGHTSLSRKLYPASLDGMSKASSLSVFEHTETGSRTIVMAIRGSASLIDWAVNFDGNATAPGDFLPGAETASALVHTGLLTIARKMSSRLLGDLDELLNVSSQADQPCNVIFTGHSAGGGVAALLYAHSLLAPSALRQHTSLKLHCITFGSPPFISTPFLVDESVPEGSMFVCVVNSGDPVPRADKPYIKSLLNLFLQRPAVDGASWPTPPAELRSAGTTVVIRDAGEGVENEWQYLRPDRDQWDKLVFGNAKAHNMETYMVTARALQGRFGTAGANEA